MSYQNNKYKAVVADESHNGLIQAIYDADSFPGRICVKFLRNPNPVASFQREGDKAVIILLVDTERNDRPVGMGACIIRKEFIDGRVNKIGYLTGLKIVPEYRKKIFFIPKLYEYLRSIVDDDISVFYTTILSENEAAIKLFEKKRKGIPEYSFQGEYTTYMYTSAKKQGEGRLHQGLCEKLKIFYNESLNENNFSPVDLLDYGMKPENYYYLEDEAGQITAACGVLNQEQTKQYQVTEYKGLYKLASYLPSKMLGYPSFPREKANAKFKSVFALRSANENVEAAEMLLRFIAQEFPKDDFMLIGLHDSNYLKKCFEKIRHISYKSRFYTVLFDDMKDVELGGKPIGVEVSLL